MGAADFTKRYNRIRQAGVLQGNSRAAQAMHQAQAAAVAATAAASTAAAAAAAPTGPTGAATAAVAAVPGIGKKATLTPAEEAKLQQRIFLGARRPGPPVHPVQAGQRGP